MNDTCLLCGSRGATRRTGRLGRYALTCQRCEQRRGAHLAPVDPRGALDERMAAAGVSAPYWDPRA